MKARCCHRVPWFMVCPWCQTDASEALYRGDPSRKYGYAFWRNMNAEQAREEVENQARLAILTRRWEKIMRLEV